ncbi:MAG: type II secretion system F family protein, partial [Deltaproteobacteria bacterium]|nr:type II secretion system F family protein [Deltaproteobacteria bacterium]
PQMQQPLRRELTQILLQLHQGKNASLALLGAALCQNNAEFATFSVIVGTLLQRGGSLGGFLKKFEKNIKYKLQTESKIHAETRQFYFQAILCCSIPWCALLAYAFFMPQQLSSSLSNPLVQKLFVISLVLNIVGFYSLKHIARRVTA